MLLNFTRHWMLSRGGWKVWAKSEDIKQEVHDPLEEIKLGDSENPHVTYISKLLTNQDKQEIIEILREFKDCVA